MEMNFSNVSDISGYVTCDDGENDDTKYLSVLSPDMCLDDIHVTVSNETSDNSELTQVLQVGEENPQTFIFSYDGTNEIYGLEIAEDEEGNLQKFQIQYTQNIEGELVPLPETLEVLSLDNEVANETSIIDDCNDVNELLDDETIREEHFQENIEFQNETTLHPQREMVCIKQELQDLIDESVSEDPPQDSIQVDENLENRCDIEESNNYLTVQVDEMSFEVNEEPFVKADINENKFVPNEKDQIEEVQQQVEVENTIHFEQLFIEGEQIANDEEPIENTVPLVATNDSNPEIYHIVNGIHIAEDGIVENGMPMPAILKESVEHHGKTNILKKPTQRVNRKEEIPLNDKIIFVQTLTEKENLGVVERSPRSLLKCNQAPQPLEVIPRPLDVQVVREVCPQRYSRTKEANQARQFLNFINSTTIPQVPERKDRLPRKQQIKPVKHLNEDIEVKEMLVSSNGFMEPISAEERKNLPISEYVELIDSGEECETTNANSNKKSSKQAELVEIEISDSDESTPGNSPNSKSSIPKRASPITKKKRARHSKGRQDTNRKDSDSNSESPPKISRTLNDLKVVQVRNGKETSEREGDKSKNLIDEIQQEFGIGRLDDQIETSQDTEVNGGEYVQLNKVNNEKSASSSSSALNGTEPKSQKSEGYQYKHLCEKCNSRFINKFLLLRHDCAAKSAVPFSCDACERRFTNLTSLNIHKRTHNKDSQATKKVSCKIPQNKKPADTKSNNLKSSQLLMPKQSGVSAPSSSSSRLSVLHKKTTSGTISNVGRPSYLPKTQQAPPRVTSTTTKQSVIPKIVEGSRSSLRNASTLKVPLSESHTFITPNKASKPKISTIGKDCEKCPMKFDNQTSWFNHQVLQHGLSTPDKTIGEGNSKKKLVKPPTAHNGIPALPLVAKHFSLMRNKMQQK